MFCFTNGSMEVMAWWFPSKQTSLLTLQRTNFSKNNYYLFNKIITGIHLPCAARQTRLRRCKNQLTHASPNSRNTSKAAHYQWYHRCSRVLGRPVWSCTLFKTILSFFIIICLHAYDANIAVDPTSVGLFHRIDPTNGLDTVWLE